MKFLILFSITFTCGFIANYVSNVNPLSYEAIFNFGDSISDTGNAVATHPRPLPSSDGSTYFKHSLIEEGAVQLAIPGNFPMGCNALVLDMVNSSRKEDYDQFECLIGYNTFIEDFNGQLKQAIETLRKKYPQPKIMYFDYYNNARRLFQEPQQYGLTSDKNVALKACCVYCASPSYTICADVTKRLNWDEPHFTETAYRLIAKGLVEDSLKLMHYY